METLMKSQLPMLIRYGLVIVFTLLTAVGLLSEEQNTFLGGQTDVIAGALGTLATIAWAMWKRPSAKALEVAKEADKMPKKADIEVIAKTPTEPLGFDDVFDAGAEILKKVVVKGRK